MIIRERSQTLGVALAHPHMLTDMTCLNSQDMTSQTLGVALVMVANTSQILGLALVDTRQTLGQEATVNTSQTLGLALAANTSQILGQEATVKNGKALKNGHEATVKNGKEATVKNWNEPTSKGHDLKITMIGLAAAALAALVILQLCGYKVSAAVALSLLLIAQHRHHLTGKSFQRHSRLSLSSSEVGTFTNVPSATRSLFSTQHFELLAIAECVTRGAARFGC